MAEAQYRAWQLYGQDAVVAQSDNYYIAEGFGVEVEHHEDSTPTLKTPVVHTLDDIDRLRVPNPATDGRMPVYLPHGQPRPRRMPLARLALGRVDGGPRRAEFDNSDNSGKLAAC